MRLLALLQARRVASAIGADYGFLWPETDFPEQDKHNVGDPALIFSAPYLDRHLVPAAKVQSCVPILAHAKTPLDELVAEARGPGILLVERPLPVALPNEADLPSNADLFDAIDWTEPVRQAMAAARELPIDPASAAIHIRGGDILHGTCSNSGTYAHKAVSVFEIEALAGRLAKEGRPVWLIGQEPDLIAHVVATNSAARSLDQTRQALGLSDVAAVFFDVIAMSRMAEVYSGRSGVAHLACQLGDARYVDTKGLDLALHPADYAHDPLAAPVYKDVSGNLKSHSYYKLFYLTEPSDWTTTDLELARLMLRWRPNGQFAKLMLCIMSAHFGHWDEAEALAVSVIGPEPHEGWPDVVVDHVMSRYDRMPKQLIAELAPARAEDHPACAFLAACARPKETSKLPSFAARHGLALSEALQQHLARLAEARR